MRGLRLGESIMFQMGSTPAASAPSDATSSDSTKASACVWLSGEWRAIWCAGGRDGCADGLNLAVKSLFGQCVHVQAHGIPIWLGCLVDMRGMDWVRALQAR